jgi:hypothetical protein
MGIIVSSSSAEIIADPERFLAKIQRGNSVYVSDLVPQNWPSWSACSSSKAKGEEINWAGGCGPEMRPDPDATLIRIELRNLDWRPEPPTEELLDQEVEYA